MRTASLCDSAMRTASSSERVRGAGAVIVTAGGVVTCAGAIAGVSRAAAARDTFRILPSLRARSWAFLEDTFQEESCFDRLVRLLVVLREPFLTCLLYTSPS